MMVKLHLKKLIHIKPIYWLKLCVLGQIRNQRGQKKSKKKKLFLKTCKIFLRVEKKLLTLLKAKYFNKI